MRSANERVAESTKPSLAKSQEAEVKRIARELLAKLKALGVTRKSRPGRALLRAVDLGYITELRCAMPVCERGEDRRGDFEPYSRPLPNWMWSAEHKVPKRLGGKLTPDNVMLAHRACNREDFAKTVRKGKRRPLTP